MRKRIMLLLVILLTVLSAVNVMAEAENIRSVEHEGAFRFYSPAAAASYYKGQIVTFGKYEGSSIQWKVIDVRSDRVLLISRYGLEARPYNTIDRDVIWETCSLRSWLNDTFYYNAFSSSERKKILEVRNDNPDNPEYGT